MIDSSDHECRVKCGVSLIVKFELSAVIIQSHLTEANLDNYTIYVDMGIASHLSL